MNQVYRIIWNHCRQTFVAVSELAKACGKRASGTAGEGGRKRQPMRRRILAAAVAACFIAPAYANPIGAQVVNGAAAINQAGNTLTVTNSPNAIINWQSFSINPAETTRFIQQSAASAVLNRVLGPDPSQLLGALQSNGKVFLINPAGILVGQGAKIDVAGFVASTLNLSDADFLANKLNFGPNLNAGAIQNLGSITTPDGGTVYLVAPQVTNQGIITTPKGETILAAGNTVQLIDTGAPGVAVQITGSAGNATNLGQILADAGRIGMVAAAIKNSGTLSATSLVNQGGRIYLKASQAVTVDGAASISATGTTGGTIEVLGSQVVLDGTATLDASGTNGGGTILVGGDAHGANPNVQNALNTFVGAGVTLNADSTLNGNGGKVVVWSDNATQFNGNISAQGGTQGGNGGWVEVSGKQKLGYTGLTNTLAAKGLTGTLLLDPTDITISTAADTVTMLNTAGTFTDVTAAASNLNTITLQNQLALSNVIVDTTSGLAGVGNITVQDSITWSGTSNLTLNATGAGGITVNATDTLAAPLVIRNTAGLGGLTMQTAGGAITLNTGATIWLAGGRMTVNGPLTIPGTINSLILNNVLLDVFGTTSQGTVGGPYPASIVMNGGANIVNHGAWTMNNATYSLAPAGVAPTPLSGFYNLPIGPLAAGSVTIPAGGAATFNAGVSFMNAGTLTQTGTLINSNLVNTGVLNVNAAYAGHLTNTGTLNVTAGANFAGDIDNRAAMSITGAATFQRSLFNSPTGTLSLTGATVSLTGGIMNSGILNMSGSTVTACSACTPLTQRADYELFGNKGTLNITGANFTNFFGLGLGGIVQGTVAATDVLNVTVDLGFGGAGTLDNVTLATAPAISVGGGV